MSTGTHSPLGAEQFHRYYQKLRPALKKPRMRASTTAVFSFLAMALFAWYAIRPTAQTIIYLRREISDKTTLNEQMENKITALIEAQSVYETIEDRLLVLDQALPEDPDAVILARQLRNLARISGASISALQIPSLPVLGSEATPGAKLTPSKALEEFPLSLTITGEYRALKAFMDGLLTLRRIASIDSIALHHIGGEKLVSNELQAIMRLVSYYSIQ